MCQRFVFWACFVGSRFLDKVLDKKGRQKGSLSKKPSQTDGKMIFPPCSNRGWGTESQVLTWTAEPGSGRSSAPAESGPGRPRRPDRRRSTRSGGRTSPAARGTFAANSTCSAPLTLCRQSGRISLARVPCCSSSGRSSTAENPWTVGPPGSLPSRTERIPDLRRPRPAMDQALIPHRGGRPAHRTETPPIVLRQGGAPRWQATSERIDQPVCGQATAGAGQKRGPDSSGVMAARVRAAAVGGSGSGPA